MGTRRLWDALRGRGAGGTAAREVTGAAERVVARAAARNRLAAVEAEIALLLADDRVFARGRRLVALEGARDDLLAELADDEPSSTPR